MLSDVQMYKKFLRKEGGGKSHCMQTKLNKELDFLANNTTNLVGWNYLNREKKIKSSYYQINKKGKS